MALVKVIIELNSRRRNDTVYAWTDVVVVDDDDDVDDVDDDVDGNGGDDGSPTLGQLTS